MTKKAVGKRPPTGLSPVGPHPIKWCRDPVLPHRSHSRCCSVCLSTGQASLDASPEASIYSCSASKAGLTDSSHLPSFPCLSSSESPPLAANYPVRQYSLFTTLLPGITYFPSPYFPFVLIASVLCLLYCRVCFLFVFLSCLQPSVDQDKCM